MNKRMLLGMACVRLPLAMGVGKAGAAQKAKPEGQLTGAGEKLPAQYTEMLTALRAEIAKAVPDTGAKKRGAFLKAHAAEVAGHRQTGNEPGVAAPSHNSH